MKPKQLGPVTAGTRVIRPRESELTLPTRDINELIWAMDNGSVIFFQKGFNDNIYLT